MMMGNLGEGQETGWLVSQRRRLRHRLSIRFSNKKKGKWEIRVKKIKGGSMIYVEKYYLC